MLMEDSKKQMTDATLLNELDHSNSSQDDSSLSPTSENQREFRNALGKFSTGVTIITTKSKDGPVGITVNSFSSVSLDPALVLWSLSKGSGRYDTFKNAKHFCVHVLRDNQFDLAMSFSKNPDHFDECNWRYNGNKIPVISDTLARFECTKETTYEGGDHTIILGKVKQFFKRDGKPLIFSSGEFGSFAS